MPNSEQFTQASIDIVINEKNICQETYDWHSNVNKTYDLGLIALTEDGTRIFPATGSMTGEGRRAYYVQWRTDNPNAIAYVDGSGEESTNYHVWNEVVNGVVHPNGTCLASSAALTEMSTRIDEFNTQISWMTENLIS